MGRHTEPHTREPSEKRKQDRTAQTHVRPGPQNAHKIGGEVGDIGGEGGNGLAIVGGGGSNIGDGVDSLLLVGGLGMIG